MTLRHSILVLLLASTTSLTTAFSQEKTNKTSLRQVLDSLERSGPHRFFFDEKTVDTLQVALPEGTLSFDGFLSQLLLNTSLQYLQRGNRIYLYDRKFSLVTSLPHSFFSPETTDKTESTAQPSAADQEKKASDVSMEYRLIEIGDPKSVNPRPRISGYLRDARSGEALSGAVIREEASGRSILADQDGYYTMELSPGRHTMVFSHSGMMSSRRNLQVYDNGKLNVDLREEIPTLNAVVVVAEMQSNTRRMMMGVEQVSVRTIKEVPALLGEPDILRVVMSLPGVTSVGEASTGFNVRGGAADQNLVLFNGATIFNPAHLFGFFTAFNTESVKGVDLYKSSIPARFGGRLSSVLDVEGREGNNREWKGNAGINFLTGKLTLEGPIVKDKTSLLIGGRGTYSNWLIRQINNPEYNNSTADFYDADLHLHHRISEKDKLALTLYSSRDAFRIAGDSSFAYGNQNGVLRWKHVFHNRLTMQVTGGIDRYGYRVKGNEGTSSGFQLDFRLQQIHGRADFRYAINKKHVVEFGAQAIRYQLDPGSLEKLGQASDVIPEQVPREQAWENALYLSDKFTISPSLSLEGGIRYSLYRMVGPRDVRQYIPGLPRTDVTVTDTLTYGSGETVKAYHGPEWRLAARYALGENASVKAGINSLRQYLHLLTNTAAVSPIDIWKLSDPYLRPQTGYQASLGYYRDFNKGTIETSVEVYYKRMKNVLDFKSGATLLLNPNPETEVINTQGKAYGLEAMIRKNGGRLTGWISYTFSRVFLRMDDSLAGQQINRGEYYPANYDKPHMVNLVAHYKFSHRYGVSFTMNYSTGRPITLPVAIFRYAGSQRIYYSDRNQFRIPDYFRMDLSFNLDGNHRVKQKVHLFWTVGAYNLTGRDNPYSVYFTENNGQVMGYQLSVIGTIIPYVTLNMKF